MIQEIAFVRNREVMSYVEVPDVFEPVKLKNKLANRLLRWIFRKYGKVYNEPKVTIERMLIDKGDIIERLIRQQRAIFEVRHEPKRVLMGSEDFAELMNRKDTMQFVTIPNIEYRVGRDGGYKVMNLELTIIPWMKGVLVMP
jgi:hypothetical protein